MSYLCIAATHLHLTSYAWTIHNEVVVSEQYSQTTRLCCFSLRCSFSACLSNPSSVWQLPPARVSSLHAVLSAIFHILHFVQAVSLTLDTRISPTVPQAASHHVDPATTHLLLTACYCCRAYWHTRYMKYSTTLCTVWYVKTFQIV
jgi:hypothetical protein